MRSSHADKTFAMRPFAPAFVFQRDAGATRCQRWPRCVLPLALVIPLVLVVPACGGTSGGSKSSASYVTGSEIAQALDQQVTDKQGNPISASCPNERMLEGDKITCRANFSDGSYHDVVATVTGFRSDDTPSIKVGLP
jgi:hypothetical protein